MGSVEGVKLGQGLSSMAFLHAHGASLAPLARPRPGYGFESRILFPQDAGQPSQLWSSQQTQILRAEEEHVLRSLPLRPPAEVCLGAAQLSTRCPPAVPRQSQAVGKRPTRPSLLLRSTLAPVLRHWLRSRANRMLLREFFSPPHPFSPRNPDPRNLK